MGDVDIKAAFAADAEPLDEGFSQRVSARVLADDRRRETHFVFMAIGAMALFAALLRGLQELSPVWSILARQNWFALSPAAIQFVSAGAPIAAFLLILFGAFPFLRSET